MASSSHAFARFRQRVGWLALLVAPLLTLLGLGVTNIVTQYQLAHRVDLIAGLADNALALGALVHELQLERGMSVAFLHNVATGTAYPPLIEQRQRTDQAILFLPGANPAVEGIVPADAGGNEYFLGKTLRLLDRLAEIRQQLDRHQLEAEAVIRYYADTNRHLIDQVEQMAKPASGTGIRWAVDGLVHLLRGKEQAGIERAMVMHALSRNNFDRDLSLRVMQGLAEQKNQLQAFLSSATPEQKAFYRRQLGGSEDAVQAMEWALFERMGEKERAISPEAWFQTVSRRIDRLHAVERQLVHDLQALVRIKQEEAWQYLILYGIGILGLLLLGLFTAWKTLRLLGQLDDSRQALRHQADRLEEEVKSRTQRLRQETEERRQAEEHERAARAFQGVVSEILRQELAEVELEHIFQQALDHFFSLPWLKERVGGLLFLVGEDRASWRLIAHHGLPDDHLLLRGPGVGLEGCTSSPATRCLRIGAEENPAALLFAATPEGVPLPSEGLEFFPHLAETLAMILHHRQSEEERHRLFSVVEQNSASVVITDRAGAIVYVNPRFSQVTGYSAAEAIGQNLRLLKSGKQPRNVYDDLWQSITSGQEWRGELCNRRKDGTLYWEQATIAPIIAANGEITHFFAVKEEITARKEAEEGNLRSRQAHGVIYDLLRLALAPVSLQEQMAAALDRILAIPWLAPDPQGAIFLMEEGKKGLLLAVASGGLASVCSRIVPGSCLCSGGVVAQRPLFTPHRSHTVHSCIEPVVHHHYSLPIMQGEQVLGVVNLFIDSAHGGNLRDDEPFQAIAATLASLIERERGLESQRQAEAARQTAELSDRAKSEFLANMSHEIRTPMNGVSGMLELLNSTKLNLKQQQMVHTALESADNLLNILNDILDFSKIQAGRMQMERIPLSPLELLEGVVAQSLQPAHAKGVEISCFIPRSVPSRIYGDPTRLRQVVFNLVSNAIKFTAKGEVAVRAMVEENEEQPETPWLRFEVADTGIGLDEHARQRLFAPFIQADSSITRRHGGTGLGLAICRQLVERMEGQIGLETLPGQGSTFWFTIPIEPAPDLPEPDLPTFPVGCRALVVDDHPTHRAVLSGYLREFGLETVSFADGPRALAWLRGEAERGISYFYGLLDLQMAPMDGIELLNQIKEEPALSGMRLLLLSAIDGVEYLPGDQYIHRFLVKPVRRRELLEALHEGSPRRPALAIAPPVVPWQGRLLLAEDSPTNQQVALGLLGVLGLSVEVAENGQKAVELFARGGFDLVLMDIQMPEMDGMTATRAIRRLEGERQWPRTPVVAITANVQPRDMEMCQAAGMDDFVGKPLRRARIEQMLNRWLGAGRGTAPVAADLPRQEEAIILDRQVLEELEVTLRPLAGGFQRVIHTFLHEGNDQLEAMGRAAQQQDLTTLRRLAHSMKSGGLALGGKILGEAARLLEEAAHEGRQEELPGLQDKVKMAYAQLVAALREAQTR